MKLSQPKAMATVNVAETCEQLKVALALALGLNGDTRSVQIFANRLVDSVRRIPTEVAGNILRSLFYPYGTKALENPSYVCSANN